MSPLVDSSKDEWVEQHAWGLLVRQGRRETHRAAGVRGQGSEILGDGPPSAEQRNVHTRKAPLGQLLYGVPLATPVHRLPS